MADTVSFPGFGFGICRLAACIAILLVICFCFSRACGGVF